MQRVDSAKYNARITLPDSTYTVRLEICIPTERVPQGILEFAYQSESLPLLPNAAMDLLDDNELALQFERETYPWNFYAYYQYWESLRGEIVRQTGGISRNQAAAKVDSILQLVLSQREPTFNWYMTVARLHANRVAGDSLEHIYIDSAVQAQLRVREFDPLLENLHLWDNFFAPELRGEDVIMQTDRTRLTLDLAAAYPRTELGKTWMLRSTGFRQLDTAKVGTIITAWSHTQDVDVLIAIASRLLIKDALIFDPVKAEIFSKRSENSSLLQLGFRNGENIFGSMGRIDGIRASIINAYVAQGRHSEAIAFGRKAMRTTSSAYGRQKISQALVAAARSSGDSALAETFRNYELPVLADFAYLTMEGKSGRLADHIGKVIVIDFWYIGCGGCAIEHKSLNNFGLKYKDNPRVVFLSVARNNKETLSNYLARSPLQAVVVPDADATCTALGITAYPTHVIIDQTGKTVLWQVGGSSSTGEKLALDVEKLLK